MNGIYKVVALLLLAASFGLSGACAVRASREYRLAPSPSSGYSVEEGLATMKTDSFRLTVGAIEDAGRAAFIRSKVAGASDPFGPASDGVPRFLTFRLIVENLSEDEQLAFQPQNILLATDRGERLYPLDFPEAYRRLAGDANRDPRLLEDLSTYLFDVGVTLEPRIRIDRLLIYPASRDPWKKLRMEFNFVQTRAASSSFDIFFTKVPLP